MGSIVTLFNLQHWPEKICILSFKLRIIIIVGHFVFVYVCFYLYDMMNDNDHILSSTFSKASLCRTKPEMEA